MSGIVGGSRQEGMRPQTVNQQLATAWTAELDAVGARRPR